MSEDTTPGLVEEPRKAEKLSPVAVRVVSTKGDSALVEWEDKGGLRRAYIPATAVAEGREVSAALLRRGIPYGVPWEKVKMDITPERLAAGLRRHGIWTWEDLQKGQKVALGVLQSTYGAGLAALNQLAYESQ